MRRGWPNGSFVRTPLQKSFSYGTYAARCFLSTSSVNRAEEPLRKQLKTALKASKQGAKSQQVDPAAEEKKARLSRWRLTVGIEIHAQLNTASKLFSPASAEYDERPNSSLAAFDLAVPGSQPVLQYAALIPALRAAVALNCTVQTKSSFDRKHYFYHDQPAGYQITQYYAPFAKDGFLDLVRSDGLETEESEVRVGIKQIQLEQDTARTQEQDGGTNLIDFNRSGHPLIEIISLPHIHTATAAAAYVRKVAAILQAVDAVTTGMELGGLRADVNVSVTSLDDAFSDAPAEHSYAGVSNLGQRTEIKNLSSPSAVLAAVSAEFDRQTDLLESGQAVSGETRGWSLSRPGTTTRLRGKEGEVDYRYMPDPDIAPLLISEDVMEYFKQTLPPLPVDLRRMLEMEYGLSNTDAEILCALNDGNRLLYYQDVVAQLLDRPDLRSEDRMKLKIQAANFTLHELGALLATRQQEWTADLVSSQQMANLVKLQFNGKITGTSAKQLLQTMFDGDRGTVEAIATRDGLFFVSMTEKEYDGLIAKVIEQFPGDVEIAKGGGKKSLGKVKFLLGQALRLGDRNRIDVQKLESILKERIEQEN